jgi:hypothetical protein
MSTSRSTQLAGRAYAVATLPELDIWNWPLVDGGWRSWLVVLGTLSAGAVAWRISSSPLMGLLSSVVLMLSMWRFWLPVRYHIHGRGIIENCLGRRRLIPWRSIEQCRLRKHGVVIRLDPKQLWFDGFGATYIQGRDQQESLAAVIHFYRKTDPNHAVDPTNVP